jgi:hypothetical protein
MPKEKVKKINIKSKKEKKSIPKEKTMTPTIWTPLDIMDTIDK